MNRISVVTALSILVSGCGGGITPSPISPSVSPAPARTFTVSGIVYGAAGVPVQGALVRVAGKEGTTDGNGYYSLPNVPGSYGGVMAMKEGHAVSRQTLTVSGDTVFDFHLGPRVAIYTLSGVVSELTPRGLVPIEGVLVEEYSCEELTPLPPFFNGAGCMSGISQTTTTDRRGFYSFSGLYAGKGNGISLRKDGFDDPRFPAGSDNDDHGSGHDDPNAVTVTGDTRVDLQLVRR